ncbi:MAG: DNA repair protein RadC [Pseudomonadota bacterium]
MGAELDGQGPRDRLLSRGARALTTAELLSVCLRTGAPGIPALWLAHGLLAESGGLSQLLELPVQRLLALPGLGPAKVAGLLAIDELGRRRLTDGLSQHAPLADSHAAIDYLRGVLGHHSRELFGCLFLDARHRPLGFEVLFAGSVDRAQVHPREVLRRALSFNAGAVILAHNHPSGCADPSASDRQLTARLQRLLAEIDVNLLDHIVVSPQGATSLAELGDLADAAPG